MTLGVSGWLLTGRESPTALIPAAFGLLLLALGSLARQERLRKHAMHGAAAVGLLGFLGSARGLLQVPALVAGTAERPVAVISQTVMAVLCAVFVWLCVRSFIAVRKAREATR